MNIVHLAIVSPHRAGLYETVRDIVAAEVALGHEACIVDPQQPGVDRGAPMGHAGRVEACDVLVNHSGLGSCKESSKPIVHCLHGRPESSFRLENNGSAPVYSMLERAAKDPQYKRFVTFWPETLPFWELLLADRDIDVLPPPVDLSAWTPDGPSGYTFGGQAGQRNVVIADLWREDRTPFHAIHGFVAARMFPQVKLHIYGRPKKHSSLDVLLRQLERIGALGEVRGLIVGLANVYRSADLVLSSNVIATRTVREALACGCPVLHAGRADIGTTGVNNWEDPLEWADSLRSALTVSRSAARSIAEDKYDAKETARQLIAICEEVVDGTG